MRVCECARVTCPIFFWMVGGPRGSTARLMGHSGRHSESMRRGVTPAGDGRKRHVNAIDNRPGRQGRYRSTLRTQRSDPTWEYIYLMPTKDVLWKLCGRLKKKRRLFIADFTSTFWNMSLHWILARAPERFSTTFRRRGRTLCLCYGALFFLLKIHSLNLSVAVDKKNKTKNLWVVGWFGVFLKRVCPCETLIIRGFGK